MAQVYISQYARRAALADTASYALNAPTAAIALPGGQDTQIQFNSGGIALNGSSNLTFNYTSNPQVLSMTGSTILSGSTFLFGLTSSTAPQVLIYDDTSGQVYYTASAAFGGVGSSPGGPSTAIQFNDNGNFNGSSSFTFNGVDIVQLTGSMLISGAISASYGLDTVGFYGTSSWAVSASRAITASLALTASSAISASYASSSPNFANTDLEFTGNRKHSTNNYSYFIYSDIVGGSENPFDGIGVSGSFYFFNSSSNALGTAAGSTNTYTYIEITTQSIDLSFNADPIVPSVYTFTKTSASFSSSLTVTKSVFFPGLTSASQLNVVMIDTASGQLYYLNSSSLGGNSTANIAISSSGTGLTATVASIDFTGAGVTTSAVGNDVTVTIPGGAGVAGGANTQIQFNSASAFSGSGNFSFDYDNSIVYLTGSSLTSGSITLTGSMFVSGAISASFGPNTVGFFGTASWAQSASFVTASNVWGPFGSSSIMSASYASGSTSASYAGTASVILNPYPINVTGSTLYSVFPGSFIVGNLGNPSNTVNSIFLGATAGGGAGINGSAQSVVAIGTGAGNGAAFGNINGSNFIGDSAGFTSFRASQSNFIGAGAGYLSYGAHNSNFIGTQAGAYLSTTDSSYSSGSYSNFIGHQAGLGHGDGFGNFSSVGHNNTIIGTNISLPDNTSNYVNLGGAFFISGTYFNSSPVFPYSYNSAILTSSINTAKVGINLWNPSYSLHVSGTVAFPNLTDTSQTNVVTINTTTGQLFYTASNAIGGGGSGTPTPPGGLDTQIQFNSGSSFSGSGNFTFNYRNNIVILTGSSLITGSLIVTGSTSVLGTSSINGIALIGTSSAQALYTTARITTIAGLNTIYSLPTASYDGAFFDYTLISGTNARAGQIMSIWSGSQVRYTETTTTDIGSTSNFIFSVALTAGSASLQVTGSTGAVIKTIIKGI